MHGSYGITIPIITIWSACCLHSNISSFLGLKENGNRQEGQATQATSNLKVPYMQRWYVPYMYWQEGESKLSSCGSLLHDKLTGAAMKRGNEGHQYAPQVDKKTVICTRLLYTVASRSKVKAILFKQAYALQLSLSNASCR